MEWIRELLEENVALADEEWQAFSNLLEEESFSAKSEIVAEGQIARKIYFIDEGLLRTYHIQKGKEINTYFATDKQVISTFASIITQSPSFEYLEVIEDSTVYSLQYSGLMSLYQQYSSFEQFGRILAEKNYLCILDRTILMQTKTAKEKYTDFIKTYNKKIIQRVPQHHIASFLGIAPESLSRIRKEIVS